MRLNKFLSQTGKLSRRMADIAVEAGRVSVNGRTAEIGQQVDLKDIVELDGQPVALPPKLYLLLNKPVGYITSRNSQGNSPTVYSLLEPIHQGLRYAGRLDKDSSGLIVMTNDGDFIQRTTHPSFEKTKVYEVELNVPLLQADIAALSQGVRLPDGISRLKVTHCAGKHVTVLLHEGRNRQVRRTFAALGYTVLSLHRTAFGRLRLGGLPSGQVREISPEDVL